MISSSPVLSTASFFLQQKVSKINRIRFLGFGIFDAKPYEMVPLQESQTSKKGRCSFFESVESIYPNSGTFPTIPCKWWTFYHALRVITTSCSRRMHRSEYVIEPKACAKHDTVSWQKFEFRTNQGSTSSTHRYLIIGTTWYHMWCDIHILLQLRRSSAEGRKASSTDAALPVETSSWVASCYGELQIRCEVIHQQESLLPIILRKTCVMSHSSNKFYNSFM